MSFSWRRGREAAMIAAVLCAAAALAMVLIQDSNGHAVALLFKWGPPSMHPAGQSVLVQADHSSHTSLWSPPTVPPTILREEVVRPVHAGRNLQQKPKQSPLAVNVNLDQANTEGDTFAPVNVNIVLPEEKTARTTLQQATTHAQQSAHHAVEARMGYFAPVEPVMFARPAAAPVPVALATAATQHPLPARREAAEMPAVTMALASTQPHRAPEEQVERMVKGMVSATALRGMEETLKEDIRDAQDSAISAAGVARVDKLQREEQAVARRLAKLPSILSASIRKAGEESDSAADAISKIKARLSTMKSRMAVARKEQGPREVQELQAKVELQRAAADALADVMNKPPVHFAPLDKPAETRYTGPSLHALTSEQTLLRKELRANQHKLAAAEAERKALVMDRAQAEQATEKRGEDLMLERGAKGKPIALNAPTSSRLASLGKGSQTMLAEDAEQGAASADGQVWCQWGSEMVKCAPGHGGAWKEHHVSDGGIWPTDMPEGKHVSVRRHVEAGKRSHSYMDDMFKYGAGGIFGAKKKSAQPKVAHDKMLSGAHRNAKAKTAHAPHTQAGWAEQAGAVTAKQQQQLAKSMHADAGAVTQAKTASSKEEGRPKHEKTVNEIVEAGLQADRLRHNTVAPEWTDRLLGQAKKAYQYMSSNLDYSHLPSGRKLADNWGASVHGLVDPEFIDELIKPPAKTTDSTSTVTNSNGLDTAASSLARIRPLKDPKELAKPTARDAVAVSSRLQRQRRAAMAALEKAADVS